MNATTASYIIAYTGLYSVFLSLALAIYRFPYLRGPVFVFAGLQAVGGTIVLLSTLILKYENGYLSFIDTATDAIAMSMMYAPLMPTRLLRRAVGWFGPVFLAGLVIDYSLREDHLQTGDTLAAGIECLVVIGILLLYLRQLLDNTHIISLRRNSMFLISTGLLAVSVVVAPVYFFVQPLMSYSMTMAMRAYDLMFTISLLSHILYAIAFWFTKADSVVSPETYQKDIVG